MVHTHPLREFVMKKATSTGGPKRLCVACGKWVSDEHRTRSEFCLDQGVNRYLTQKQLRERIEENGS